MRAPLKLATDGGRRVGRVPKAKRLAAQPATDAARMKRALGIIRAEAEKIEARGKAAMTVLEAALVAAGGEDRLIARALAREACIECGFAMRAALLVRYCEMAEEGTLCA